MSLLTLKSCLRTLSLSVEKFNKPLIIFLQNKKNYIKSKRKQWKLLLCTVQRSLSYVIFLSLFPSLYPLEKLLVYSNMFPSVCNVLTVTVMFLLKTFLCAV